MFIDNNLFLIHIPMLHNLLFFTAILLIYSSIWYYVTEEILSE